MQQNPKTLLASCYNTLVTLSLVLTSLPLLAQSPTTPPTANKDAFITTWDSTDVVTIPMNPDLDYNYLVNWGDGSAAERITNKQAVRMGEVLTTSHTYQNKGPHTVRITGQFPAIQFGIIKEANDKHREEIDPFDKDMVNKIIAINQWGTINWQSMAEAFTFCENLEVFATDVPNLSQVTNMEGMFAGATRANPEVSHWDVSQVANMAYMFAGAKSANPNVSQWDVSQVTDMEGMFFVAIRAHPDVGQWDVSQVTNMERMFRDAENAHPDVRYWNVSTVTSMAEMFYNTVADPDVSQWNVSKVTDMNSMFARTPNANPNVSNWDVSQVINMAGMFAGATRANPDVSHWNVSQITDMNSMFAKTNNANPNVSNWDVSQVTNMTGMFYEAMSANPDVSQWNVSQVTDMNSMFARASNAHPDVRKWDVSKVTSMDYIFYKATSANPNIRRWNISRVTNMEGMFNNSGISPKNYTAALVNFAKQPTQDRVVLAAYNIEYCKSKKAEKARETLSARGWDIAGDKAVDCKKK